MGLADRRHAATQAAAAQAAVTDADARADTPTALRPQSVSLDGPRAPAGGSGGGGGYQPPASWDYWDRQPGTAGMMDPTRKKKGSVSVEALKQRFKKAFNDSGLPRPRVHACIQPGEPSTTIRQPRRVVFGRLPCTDARVAAAAPPPAPFLGGNAQGLVVLPLCLSVSLSHCLTVSLSRSHARTHARALACRARRGGACPCSYPHCQLAAH